MGLGQKTYAHKKKPLALNRTERTGATSTEILGWNATALTWFRWSGVWAVVAVGLSLPSTVRLGKRKLALHGARRAWTLRLRDGGSKCASHGVYAAPMLLAFSAFDRHVFSGGVLKVGMLAPSTANLSGAFYLHLST